MYEINSTLKSPQYQEIPELEQGKSQKNIQIKAFQFASNLHSNHYIPVRSFIFQTKKKSDLHTNFFVNFEDATLRLVSVFRFMSVTILADSTYAWLSAGTAAYSHFILFFVVSSYCEKMKGTHLRAWQHALNFYETPLKSISLNIVTAGLNPLFFENYMHCHKIHHLTGYSYEAML